MPLLRCRSELREGAKEHRGASACDMRNGSIARGVWRRRWTEGCVQQRLYDQAEAAVGCWTVGCLCILVERFYNSTARRLEFDAPYVYQLQT